MKAALNHRTEDKRPVALDLYCGAGGSSMGLHMAGFRVIGIDNDPAPLKRYPFEHILADLADPATALNHIVNVTNAVFILAGPPCQGESVTAPMRSGRRAELRKSEAHAPANLIAFTRRMLIATGLPYVIENVEGARENLIPEQTIRLCGSSHPFRLRVQRHRLFEFSRHLELSAPSCDHSWQNKSQIYLHTAGRLMGHYTGVLSVFGTSSKGTILRNKNHMLDQSQTDLLRVAMGIDWMSARDLSQAIPPAYTNFIGLQVLAQLSQDAALGRNGHRRQTRTLARTP